MIILLAMPLPQGSFVEARPMPIMASASQAKTKRKMLWGNHLGCLAQACRLQKTKSGG
jgi:hypothetical protein